MKKHWKYVCIIRTNKADAQQELPLYAHSIILHSFDLKRKVKGLLTRQETSNSCSMRNKPNFPSNKSSHSSEVYNATLLYMYL